MEGGHGFHPTTDTDHRAWLWVVSLLSLIYSLLCIAARLTAKWEHLWYDDLALGLAYVLAIGHYGTIFYAIFDGLGSFTTSVSVSLTATAAKYYFASRVLGILALSLSKLSLIAFTHSIFAGGLTGENTLFRTASACAVIYGIAGVLLSSAGCHPERALVNEASAVCNANVARWITLTALDVLTEILIVGIPAWAISKIRISTAKKRLVVFVFSFRLVLAGLSIAATVNYLAFLDGSRTEMDLVNTIAWQEVLVGFSLISASIPCIRSFLWAFMSMGLKTVHGSQYSASGSHDASQQLRSQHSRFDMPAGPRNIDDETAFKTSSLRVRPDWLDYKVDVRAQWTKDRMPALRRDAENVSMNSNSSEQMIIHRNTEVEVHYS